MKHIAFILSMFCWLCTAQAQNFPLEPSLPEKLAHLCAPLDKAQVPTGYLYNLAVPLVEPLAYRGSIADTNAVDINTFGMLYGNLRLCKVSSGGGLPSPSVYISKIRQLEGKDTLPLAVLAVRYDHIRPDAIQQNLLSYSGGQYHDVAGRPESPYFSDTSFVASLLFNTANTLHPVITLPSDLVLKNLGWTVSNVEVDADDGLGYRSLPVGGSLAVDYASEGSKDVRIRFHDGTRTWYAHTPLEVSQPPANRFAGYNETPDEQYFVTGIKPYLGGFARAKVQFFYSCGAKMLRRPLIVVEGFEFPGVLPPIGYKELFDKVEDVLWPGQSPSNLKDYFSQEGYDLIYVDFENNVDYIQRNAFLMEEVIRLVNQKKAEANSTEQNVVLGVSLGGLICKYALLDMQASSLVHDTRLFITYDSPLRGANIPIGVQCMVQWLSDQLGAFEDLGGGTSPLGAIPALDAALGALNSPAPKQMLLQHAELDELGGIKVLKIGNAVQAAFQAEMDVLGGLAMRHVAISNGAANGTFLENDFAPGGTLYTMDLTGNICSNTKLGIILCANVDAEMTVRATGNNTPTEVFRGWLKIDAVGIPNDIETETKITITTPPLDAMPGGNGTLGVFGIAGTDAGLRGALGSVPSITFTSSWPGAPIFHHTFIPTFSSQSAVPAANPATGQPCGTPNRCDAPTARSINETTGLLEFNQNHVQLDARIGNLLRQELEAPTAAYPFGQLTENLTTYYNMGHPAYNRLKSINISTSNGKLSINNQGLLGYANGFEANSPQAAMDAFTYCDAVVNVESGATLAIGGDHAGKSARLFATGAEIHIKPGGRLMIHDNSALIIQKNATLFLHEGAILILRDNPDGPLVENGRPRIKIESGGKLVAKGDIAIQGDGCIELDPGNILDLPENFTLSGSGKPYRFLRVNNGAEFRKEGGNLTLQDGLVETGQLGRVLHQDGGISRCLRTKFQPTIGAQMPHKGLEVVNGGTVQIQHSDFLGLQRSVFVTGAANSVSVVSSRFEHTVMEAVNVRFASMTEVIGENASFVYNGVPTSLNVNNCMLNGSYGSLAPLRLTYVKMTNMTGGIIDVPGGICIDATANGNNITLRKGATLQNGAYGIHLNGGLFGGPNAYNYGLVTMDCARILNCAGACITGRDALLNIDADINSSTLRPNEFSLDPSGPARYFDICYVKRDPGASIRARRNFWNKFDLAGNSIGPAPDDLNLVRSATVLGCEAGTAIPLLSAPAAAGYNPACPIDGYTGDKPAPGQGAYARRLLSSGPQGRLLSDKDCSMGGTDLHGNSTGAWAALYAAFDQSGLSDTEPDLSAALALFSPVASFDSAQLSGATDVCRQYVNVAQIFVLPTGVSQQRAEERSAAAPSSGSVLIAPNPAAGAFTVTLPSSPCTLRVWDARGRLAQEVYNASGLMVVDVSGWAAGLYLVEVNSVEGKVWGKVVVER